MAPYDWLVDEYSLVTASRVTVVLCYAMLCSYALLVFRSLRAGPSFVGLWHWLRSLIAAIRSKSKTDEAATLEDAVELRAGELVTAWRVQRVRGWLTVTSHISAYCLAVLVLSHLDVWSVQSVWWTKQFLLCEETLVCLVLSMFVHVLVWRPQLVTGFSIDLLHCVVAIMWSLQLAMAPNTIEQLYRAHTIKSLRFAFVALGNKRLTMFLNLVVTAIDIAMYGAHASDSVQPNCAPFDLPMRDAGARGCAGTLAYFAVHESLTLLAVVALAFLVDSWMWTEARATVRSEVSAQGEQMLQRILSAVCDAVVRLGPSFEILTPSPRLAVLLMRGSADLRLKGTSFLDLIEPDDAETFVHQLSMQHDQVGARDEPAACLHLRMIDATGTRVQAQLLHCRLVDLSGQPFHMVGIREISETGQYCSENSVFDMRSISTKNVHEAGSDGVKNGISAAQADEKAPDSFEGAAVWVDSLSGELDILHCNAGFAALGGPSCDGMPLLSWVASDADRKKLLKRVREVVNTYFCKGDADSSSILVRLRPPGMSGAGAPGRSVVEFRASCTLHLEAGMREPSKTCSSSEQFPILVKFDSLSQRHRAERSRTPRTPGSPSLISRSSMDVASSNILTL
eukprot:TRINITY_DN26312_c0_g1_i1.p1 TRINITY_DN26312_c0_g1~~TRINITY_DN26312_c0_g1_i1.p1  ORF type:complete len:624 (+),score=102.54 TRINITY_DN26312_c0_g1_i1:70-1941(+)